MEDKKYGLSRIEHLRSADAAVRFLSIEPLLEDMGNLNFEGIHWVIVGGESVTAQGRKLAVPIVAHGVQDTIDVLLIFLGTWRLVQDYVSSPRIMGRSMELHPLAAIFGVMAGGEVAGILGIYLSIPVMATLRILFRRWRLYAEKRKFGPLNEYAIGSEVGQRK